METPLSVAEKHVTYLRYGFRSQVFLRTEPFSPKKKPKKENVYYLLALLRPMCSKADFFFKLRVKRSVFFSESVFRTCFQPMPLRPPPPSPAVVAAAAPAAASERPAAAAPRRPCTGRILEKSTYRPVPISQLERQSSNLRVNFPSKIGQKLH